MHKDPEEWIFCNIYLQTTNWKCPSSTTLDLTVFTPTNVDSAIQTIPSTYIEPVFFRKIIQITRTTGYFQIIKVDVRNLCTPDKNTKRTIGKTIVYPIFFIKHKDYLYVVLHLFLKINYIFLFSSTTTTTTCYK